MRILSAHVRDAGHMMTHAKALAEGIEITFADGKSGRVPFSAIPVIREFANLVIIRLPNPYEAVLHSSRGETVEIPWDFARHYCDVSYRSKAEKLAARGQQTLGRRIRTLRQDRDLTQKELAEAAGVSRVTLARIEQGGQSPRFDTLIALALALRQSVEDLLTERPKSARPVEGILDGSMQREPTHSQGKGRLAAAKAAKTSRYH